MVALTGLASACGGSFAAKEVAQREAVLALGRLICGDCCVEQVERAFEDLPGVAALHMSPDDLDFTVELGAEWPAAEVLVERLVEAGVRETRVVPAGAAASPSKQWVMARRAV